MGSPTTDRRLGLAGNTAYKAPVTVVATANITQSGEQTIDGVSVHAVNAAGYADRVLCAGQSDQTLNGLWDVNTAAWTRSIDANGNYDLVQGTQVEIAQGSHANQVWLVTTPNPINVGSTALAFSMSLAVGFLATLAAKGGAGLIGFDRTTAYGAGTVGAHGLVTLSPRDYPWLAVGDGATDDTTALQACITYAASVNAVLDGEGRTYKISGALSGNWAAGGGTTRLLLTLTGSGYRALSIYGLLSHLDVTINGGNAACDGVLLGGNVATPFQRSKVQNIEVNNLAGNGVSLDTCWDSVFQTISINHCGTLTKNSFEMLSTGDTSNMCHIVHLQVEQGQQKAIYVDPSCLCCSIDVIHSEGAVSTTGTITWQLGGNRCQYNTVRLNAAVPGTASVLLNGANCTIVDLLVEGAIPVSAQAFSSTAMTLVTPEIQGSLGIVTQTGTITLLGGMVTNLTPNTGSWRVYSTKITNLVGGFANSDPTLMRFNGCVIGSVSGSGSTQSAATFTDCTILEHNGGLMQAVTVLENTIVSSASSLTLSVAFRTLISKGSTINGALSLNAGSLLAFGTVFNGALSIAGGTQTAIFDAGCSCTGAVSGVNAIPAVAAGSQGSHHFNIAPVTGSPKSWVKTTAGTWASEGNL